MRPPILGDVECATEALYNRAGPPYVRARAVNALMFHVGKARLYAREACASTKSSLPVGSIV